LHPHPASADALVKKIPNAIALTTQTLELSSDTSIPA